MATQVGPASVGKFYDYTKRDVRAWTVANGTPALSLVFDDVNKVAGVTLAASNGTEVSIARADGATVTKTVGGVGNRDGEAQVATDGSWLFEVTGVTAGETVGTGATGTSRGTAVYLDDDELTLSAGDIIVGVIDDCNIIDGVAAVQLNAAPAPAPAGGTTEGDN